MPITAKSMHTNDKWNATIVQDNEVHERVKKLKGLVIIVLSVKFLRFHFILLLDL